MLTRSYHAGVDGSLLNVAGNACHKGIAVLKVGVEVGLRVVKRKGLVMHCLQVFWVSINTLKI